MAKNATQKNRDDSAGHKEKLKDLFKLIDRIESGLLTTRRADGRLVSRPMATQLRTEAGHLWFVTDKDTHKVDELERDPNVNVAYYHNRTREWVSVSGRARTTTDQAMIDALYAPDWRAWFGKGGGKHSGTAMDPRLLLIEVVPDTVTYMKSDRPAIVTLFELAKGMVTGEAPKFGDMRELSSRELEEGPEGSAKKTTRSSRAKPRAKAAASRSKPQRSRSKAGARPARRS